ncbi:zinc-binding dehydrogenase [Lacticaseibacillus salsurivasis]|uniref:zinc-binding dehydrogenase n=1 Tax=Lacticaseibacillus salsurivasis TaxID=3081441 RepID=UPI0030C68AF2
MQAIKITGPVAASALHPIEVETPVAKPGYDLVKIKAFGVNESEVTSRKGESSSDFSFPRILGIEGVGVIATVAPDSPYQPGQQVAMMMTGLGREIDGTYADYCLVPHAAIIPFESALDWGTLGALPEMLQTANGSLQKGLHLTGRDSVLIRGGSSTVGLMAVSLAHLLGAQVFATTRNQRKVPTIEAFGADQVLIDSGHLADEIHAVLPAGVDKVLELVGTTTLFDSFAALKTGGTLCFTGGLAGGWEIDHFSPFMIPSGKFLTSYAGEATDLSAATLAKVLNAVAAGTFKVPIAQTYHGLAAAGEAQTNLESGQFIGKHVVVLD